MWKLIIGSHPWATYEIQLIFSKYLFEQHLLIKAETKINIIFIYKKYTL